MKYRRRNGYRNMAEKIILLTERWVTMLQKGGARPKGFPEI
jgi:hypothetical protein